jgi:hypothetical protein
MNRYLLTALLVALPLAAYAVGRWSGRRQWDRQANLVTSTLRTAALRLAETQRAEAELLKIVEEQRRLLTIVVEANDTGSWIVHHPSGRSIDTLAWVTERARRSFF